MKAGDKVVCVDDDWSSLSAELYSEFPRRGVVYVVRHVRSGRKKGKPAIGLNLVGIIALIAPNGNEYAFDSTRFRPVSEIGHPPIETVYEIPADKITFSK